MQSKPKTRRESGVSSSTCTSKKSRLKNQTKLEDICNGASVAVKKRRLASTSSSSLSDHEGKCLVVTLTDVLKDKQLRSKYGLHDQSEMAPTSSSTDSNSERGTSCLWTDYAETDSLSGAESVDAERMGTERKIIMHKNNLITITKCVNANTNVNLQQQVRTSPRGYYCGHSEPGCLEHTIAWEPFLLSGGEINGGCSRKTWQKQYAFIDSHVYKITSHDAFFEGAQLAREETPERQFNGATNITVQIPNNPPVRATSFSRNISKIVSSSVSSNSSNSSLDGQVFKVPLPPVKRPPTRPQRICFSSDGGSSSSGSAIVREPIVVSRKLEQRADTTEGHEDDDVLSIAASSLVDLAEPFPLFEEKPISEPSINSDTSMSLATSASEIAARNDDIQRWLDNSSPASTDNALSSPPPSQTKLPVVNNSSSGSVSPPTYSKTHVMETIPSIYKRMCWNYILDGYDCQRFHCGFSHNVNDVRDRDILTMDLPQVKEVYKWTVSSSKPLLQSTFKLFARRFCRLSEVNQLIKMVDDIFTVDIFDRTPYVQDVVVALRYTGMTLVRAIETLIEHDKLQNMSLLDILLNLLINADGNLAEHWCVVEEILKHRSGNIDFGVLSDIIKKTLKSDDKELCRKVCNVLTQLNNFSNIDVSLLYDFLTKLCEHRLTLHYNTLRKKTNIHHMIPGFNLQPVVQEKRPSSLPDANVKVLSNGMLQHHSQTKTIVLNDLDNSVASVSTQNERYDPALQATTPPQQQQEEDDHYLSRLTEHEHQQILNCIRTKDVIALNALINKYKFTDKMEAFALVTAAYFNDGKTYMDFLTLLKGLELIDRDFMKDPSTRSMMELICYNVIDYFTRKGIWDFSYQVLVLFEDNLDSFIKSKEFEKNGEKFSRCLSVRYLYICKIYIKNYEYKKALQILLRDDLSLFKPCTDWKIEYSAEAERYRDTLFRNFLSGALHEPYDIKSALTLIHKVVSNSRDKILLKDAWFFYNDLLVIMLNKKERYKTEIVQEFSERIFPSWYTTLRKNVLRGLGVIILRLQTVLEKDSIEFYDKCCKQDVYPAYNGKETAIIVTTDLVNEEIYLMLLTFFYKIATNGYKAQDVKIKIKSPDRLYHQPLVLYHSDVSFVEMKRRVAHVLTKAFGVLIEQEAISGIEQFVLLKEQFVTNCAKQIRDSYGVAAT